MSITIQHPTGILKGKIDLPASKSESNRLLILRELSGFKVSIDNLSTAQDTLILQRTLRSTTTEIDVEDAGTAMRFLTAYFCATNQQKKITGSARMQERPIGVLVDALRYIGYKVLYTDREGYPPLQIMRSSSFALKSEVAIAGNVSSQFISALLMIAPIMPEGLTIKFTTELVSKPYIELTLALLNQAGISSKWVDGSISIERQFFDTKTITVSADWSGASYWYSMAALTNKYELKLNQLNFNSLQGDKKVATWMHTMGVKSEIFKDGVLLLKANVLNPVLHYDFTNTPDIAQTMIVLCVAKGIPAKFKGLKSLRIKETDRIVALQTELKKCGVELVEEEPDLFSLAGKFTLPTQPILTYNDHRMAMAFAPLAILGKMTIESPKVVEKSYPDFWTQLKKVGFEIGEE